MQITIKELTELVVALGGSRGYAHGFMLALTSLGLAERIDEHQRARGRHEGVYSVDDELIRLLKSKSKILRKRAIL